MLRQHSTVLFVICTLTIGLLAVACAPLEVPGSATTEFGKASPEPTQAPAASGASQSGIEGKVIIGPTCPGPVVAESPCADQPYQATITVMDEKNQPVKQLQSDETGSFKVTLAPGTYVLHPESPGGPTQAPEQTVTVVSGQFTQVTIVYDSGIR
ncbi:MAG: carboxypeptidase-like regulatory domain-containing protein [Anaerolineales bacterium]